MGENFEKKEGVLDTLWSMPVDDQIAVLKEIFGEDLLNSFYYFQIQETCPKGQYEEETARASREPVLGQDVINYVRGTDRLVGKEEEVKRIIERGK